MRLMRSCRFLAIFVPAALFAALPTTTAAQLLEDAELAYVDDLPLLKVHFSTPVEVLGHFPGDRGQWLKIALRSPQSLQGSAEAPREKLVRSFGTDRPLRITFTLSSQFSCRPLLTNLCLMLEFDQVQRFGKVRSSDARTLLIELPER